MGKCNFLLASEKYCPPHRSSRHEQIMCCVRVSRVRVRVKLILKLHDNLLFARTSTGHSSFIENEMEIAWWNIHSLNPKDCCLNLSPYYYEEVGAIHAIDLQSLYSISQAGSLETSFESQRPVFLRY